MKLDQKKKLYLLLAGASAAVALLLNDVLNSFLRGHSGKHILATFLVLPLLVFLTVPHGGNRSISLLHALQEKEWRIFATAFKRWGLTVVAIIVGAALLSWMESLRVLAITFNAIGLWFTGMLVVNLVPERKTLPPIGKDMTIAIVGPPGSGKCSYLTTLGVLARSNDKATISYVVEGMRLLNGEDAEPPTVPETGLRYNVFCGSESDPYHSQGHVKLTVIAPALREERDRPPGRVPGQGREPDGILLVLEPSNCRADHELKFLRTLTSAGIPVAIVITKMDEQWDEHWGREKLLATWLEAQPCYDIVKDLSASLVHVKIFACSAVGVKQVADESVLAHKVAREKCENQPTGILEPVNWLISFANTPGIVRKMRAIGKSRRGAA